ncbi:MAG: fumarylacetoacetate hydrolase family protein [Candidatus Hermodarchaeota archaeon]|nr:fumarylacetoacetate hydrolase family protein [Candidatus Hermodarchaeota archaeon]
MERILQVKLVTYATDAGPRVGCIDDGEVVPTPGIPDIISLFNDNSLENSIEAALKGRIDAQPIDEMTLLAPIPRPTKIIAIGLNYRDHAEETGQQLPEAPILFSKPPTATIGHGANIIIPDGASQIDYEVELGVVIGKSGHNIPVDTALDYVGGYTVFNDVSARDYQFRDGQWFRGKSFDTFAPMGPCLTLPDQIQDPQDLQMQLRLNGKTRQNSSTANMVFSVAELIADISQVMTLEPGDVIATGTPAGVGFKVKPKPVFLQPGDVVEAEIDGIGILRNPVEKDGELS